MRGLTGFTRLGSCLWDVGYCFSWKCLIGAERNNDGLNPSLTTAAHASMRKKLRISTSYVCPSLVGDPKAILKASSEQQCKRSWMKSSYRKHAAAAAAGVDRHACEALPWRIWQIHSVERAALIAFGAVLHLIYVLFFPPFRVRVFPCRCLFVFLGRFFSAAFVPFPVRLTRVEKEKFECLVIYRMCLLGVSQAWRKKQMPIERRSKLLYISILSQFGKVHSMEVSEFIVTEGEKRSITLTFSLRWSHGACLQFTRCRSWNFAYVYGSWK